MVTTQSRVMQDEGLRLDNVSLSIEGVALLQDLNLSLGKGSLVVVLGPNGAGKTLLLRLCHGLIKPSSGACHWGSAGQWSRQTMVFQKPVMLRRSALDNIMYVLRELPRAERRERAQQALQWAGLEAIAGRMATVLSGGQQQRLAMARARALKPDILFLDEPTASLDPAACDAVEAQIRALHAEGVQIMMSTHNLAQARRLAQEIVYIEDGRIRAHQTRQAFFSEPACDSAREFIRREVAW